MKVLRDLIKFWRKEAESPTLASVPKVRQAFEACANQLENVLPNMTYTTRYVEGNGVGLAHGTVAWVLVDGVEYVREWHPMQPEKDGTQIGNWWDLEKGGMDKRFSEHEVTHYCVIGRPERPTKLPREQPAQPYGGPVELHAYVGRDIKRGGYTAFTILADVSKGEPMYLETWAETEDVALRELQLRADGVLRTFFHAYRTVRL